MIESRRNPYILHYVIGQKPWKKRVLSSGKIGVDELWYSIAKKSRFIKIINEYLNITHINLNN